MGRRAIVKIELPADRETLLKEWKEISEWIKTAQNKENQLRLKLVSDLFTAEKLEGSETVDIGWGYRLKATKNLNYNATNKEGQTEKLLAAVHAIDPGTAQALVRWQPELSVTAYRALLTLLEKHPELKEVAALAITVKPGMPELEMIAPKTEAVPVTVQSGVALSESEPITDGSDIKF